MSGRQVGEEQLDDAERAGERVVDFVRHPGAELAQRRQRPRAQKQILGLPQLRRFFVDAFLQTLVPGHDFASLLVDFPPRLLEPTRHPIECPCQIGELVAPSLRDSGSQVSRGDSAGAAGQHGNSTGESPRQDPRRERTQKHGHEIHNAVAVRMRLTGAKAAPTVLSTIAPSPQGWTGA